MEPICARCEHPLKPQARFCARCGAPATAPKVCGGCGRANEAADNFCFHCGCALAGGEAPATAAPSAPVRWLIAGILLGTLLSGGGALGWWLFERANEPSPVPAIEPVAPVASDPAVLR